ncbi:hypothetical protein D9M71_747770 [compost metagenome]
MLFKPVSVEALALMLKVKPGLPGSLPAGVRVDEFSIASLTSGIGGTQNIGKLLVAVRESLDLDFVLIKKHMLEPEKKGFARVVHQVKGAAKMISADDVSQAAAACEQALLHQQSVSEIRFLAEMLCDEMQALCRAIDIFLLT